MKGFMVEEGSHVCSRIHGTVREYYKIRRPVPDTDVRKCGVSITSEKQYVPTIIVYVPSLNLNVTISIINTTKIQRQCFDLVQKETDFLEQLIAVPKTLSNLFRAMIDFQLAVTNLLTSLM
jgi:hypothetical protein